MQVTGSALVAAPVQRVWDALQDPAVLARTIPGCHALEPTGPDTYRMTVTAGVASVQGTYIGQVELAEPDPPRSFVLRARGRGTPGTVDATVRVRLSDGEAGSTRVDYDADAEVGGMIGGVGQRMLGGVARRTAGQFFAAVAADLARPEPERAASAATGPAPVPGAPVPSTAVPGTAVPGTAVPGVPVPGGGPPARQGSAAAWPMVAAFGAGGATALAGVALGYALGRRGRRAGRPA